MVAEAIREETGLRRTFTTVLGTFSAMMACVKFRDSSLSESALSACIGHALEGMTVPVSVLRLILKEKAVSLESRGLMGQVWEEVLGAGASLGPIFLAAAGVTVIVMVGVYATSEAIEAARRKSKKKCLEMYIECTDMGPPCTTPRDRRYLLCSRCMDNCNAPAPYYTSECTQCGFR